MKISVAFLFEKNTIQRGGKNTGADDFRRLTSAANLRSHYRRFLIYLQK